MVNILHNDQQLTNDSQRSKHVPRYQVLDRTGIVRGTTHLFTTDLPSVII